MARILLAETFQLVQSDPTLLSCAKKRGVEPPRRNCPKETLERVSSGLLRKQKGCGPFEIPGVPDLKRLLMGQSSTGFGGTLFLACKHLLVCKITDDYAAEQQIWRHLSAARHFCSAKILAGRAAREDRARIAENAVPAQRNFQRKFALRRVGSYKFVVPPTIESSKVREHARFVTLSVPGSSGCQRGRAPLFGKESRGNPFKGFLWAISS